jgi:hypothetical protein
MKAAIMLGLTLFIGGCAYTAPAPSIHRRVQTVNEAEYTPYMGEGTASISGQAFLKTRGGDVKYGAGEAVVLQPVTTYSKEWWTVSIESGKRMSEPDPRAAAATRSVTADGEGRFKFEKLPAGEYYIACSVSWQYVTGRRNAYRATTGGMVGAQVRVGPAEHRDVILKLVRAY